MDVVFALVRFCLKEQVICIVRTSHRQFNLVPFCSVERQCWCFILLQYTNNHHHPYIDSTTVLSDIATTEVRARAAHLLKGFDANSADWKNHRWFSFKLPWARAKLPLDSEVKNASISTGPAMTEAAIVRLESAR